VLANAYVTRLLFNSSSPTGHLTANAVEYTRDGGETKLTVKVNKEVILAGGAIGSPAVLLYSGVGPKDVLSAAGVPLVSELPGVGQHLQDHLVSCMHIHDAYSILIDLERRGAVEHRSGDGGFHIRC
jgi:choline dehydrogenase-like flavoprotein